MVTECLQACSLGHTHPHPPATLSPNKACMRHVDLWHPLVHATLHPDAPSLCAIQAFQPAHYLAKPWKSQSAYQEQTPKLQRPLYPREGDVRRDAVYPDKPEGGGAPARGCPKPGNEVMLGDKGPIPDGQSGPPAPPCLGLRYIRTKLPTSSPDVSQHATTAPTARRSACMPQDPVQILQLRVLARKARRAAVV